MLIIRCPSAFLGSEKNTDAVCITMSEMHGRFRPDSAKQTSRHAGADGGKADGAKLVPARR